MTFPADPDPAEVTTAIRVLLVYLGIVEALVVSKIAVLAYRRRDWERVFGYTSFALAIITPALFLVRDLGHPLSRLSAAYALAVGVGLVWVFFRVRFDVRFSRLRRAAATAPRAFGPAHRR